MHTLTSESLPQREFIIKIPQAQSMLIFIDLTVLVLILTGQIALFLLQILKAV